MGTHGGGDRTRGAVAVMVAFSLIAIFGASALTIDLGNSWQQKRRLATASDAAALGASGRYASGQTGCGTAATNLVHANDPGARLVGCTHSATSGTSGTVAVTVEKDVEYLFAPILGMNSTTLTETTRTRYGIPSGMGGLRPFGLCLEALASIPAYQAWDKVNPSSPMIVPYGKDANPAACNGGMNVPGNWGIIDFDGGSNSNADTKAWVRHGYPDIVTPGWYEGDPGAFSNSLSSDLQTIVGKEFPVPLFVEATGNGANAQFHIVGYAQVELVSFRATGSAHTRYLEVRFLTGMVEGQCCDPSGVDMGIRAGGICSYDPSTGC